MKDEQRMQATIGESKKSEPQRHRDTEKSFSQRPLRLCGEISVLIAALLLASVGCQRMPPGQWRTETGLARLIDDRGERKDRVVAVAQAQYEARIKLLRFVEQMPVESNFVGDYMAQDPLVDARIRSLILSARHLGTRYLKDSTVEVKMGVNLDEALKIVGQSRQ